MRPSNFMASLTTATPSLKTRGRGATSVAMGAASFDDTGTSAGRGDGVGGARTTTAGGCGRGDVEGVPRMTDVGARGSGEDGGVPWTTTSTHERGLDIEDELDGGEEEAEAEDMGLELSIPKHHNSY